ncbi:hypothetical protein H4R18_003860 [Coemansia javaensis]|uniref:Protein phosphatase inhibitor 2 (IPP-2) n=1 Tax=Coemansia javaensis TaxID=2761396 RepID=A0A9W8H6L4_9FUNG|nr:hypothetical protein H4R18_003860 [Coemansia javaensis]
MAHPADFDCGGPKPKGILKKATDAPAHSETARLRWDEENLKLTEEQKDSRMKVLEPPTPYIRYRTEEEADWQEEMEVLRLASRSSSAASSPRRTQVVAPSGWESDEDHGMAGGAGAGGDGTDMEEVEPESAKTEQFRRLRKLHYHLEGRFVHKDVLDIDDSDSSLGAHSEPADSSDDAAAAAAAAPRPRARSRAQHPNGASPLGAGRGPGAVAGASGTGTETGAHGGAASDGVSAPSSAAAAAPGAPRPPMDVDETNASEMEL